MFPKIGSVIQNYEHECVDMLCRRQMILVEFIAIKQNTFTITVCSPFSEPFTMTIDLSPFFRPLVRLFKDQCKKEGFGVMIFQIECSCWDNWK